MLVSCISQLISRRNLLPEITEQILRPQFEHLEIAFKQMLDAFAECFREGDCSREFPTVNGALTEMNHAVQQIRDRSLSGKLPPEAAGRELSSAKIIGKKRVHLRKRGLLAAISVRNQR